MPKIIIEAGQVESQRGNYGDDWQSNDNIQTQRHTGCISQPYNPSAHTKQDMLSLSCLHRCMQMLTDGDASHLSLILNRSSHWWLL